VNQHEFPVPAGRKETPPMLRLVENAGTREAGEGYKSLDEIARKGAREMLLKALEAEVAQYLELYAGRGDDRGPGTASERPARR
jgi:hypothetical protein